MQIKTEASSQGLASNYASKEAP